MLGIPNNKQQHETAKDIVHQQILSAKRIG